MKELIKANIPGATDAQCAQLERYCSMLLEWNGRFNLTAITDPAEIVQKHLADSLLPLALFPANARVIDVGSGAGFPGLPLRILRPDLSVTLLDARNKKVAFLQAVCDELGFSNVRCLHGRAEDAERMGLAGRFDVATARAVAATGTLAGWLLPFLKGGGKALLYKGPQAEEELKEAGPVLKKLRCRSRRETYSAPWGERTIIILER